MTRVKPGYLHGETSISNLIALADESFIVVAETPGTTGDGRSGPGTQYVYRFDASGRPAEQRNDWEGAMFGSPIDLTYFYSSGPDRPLMWRDATGGSHVVPGSPDGIPFRDAAGRFWRLIHYADGAPSELWVNGRQVNMGRDDVTVAAAGCDGAVWALASDGHIWRIGAGGRTGRVIVSLPAGTGIFGSKPYISGRFTAMSDGTVWLATERDDQTIPLADQLRTHLLHLGPDGLIEEAPPAVSAFSAWAEGPDGALWLAEAHGLTRLPAHGPARSYPAPPTQWLVQDAAGMLWSVCQPDLCAILARR